jgi:hypothetical protein
MPLVCHSRFSYGTIASGMFNNTNSTDTYKSMKENTLASGFVTCPECGTQVNCGTAGLVNLVQHQGKGPCQKAKTKRDREAKALKNVSIITFMKPKPKPTLVQSAIPHSEPIHSQKLPTTLSSTPSGVPETTNAAMKSVHESVSDSFLAKLCHLIGNLPKTIPEATKYDKLAAFAGDPANYDIPGLDADDLWEESLNGQLKSVFSWGTEDDMENLIRHGRHGLDGLTNFVRHFVIKRGVSEALFEGKLSNLINKLEEMSVTVFRCDSCCSPV